MKLHGIALLVAVSVTMVACSKSDEENSEHFLSGQQRALERAKDVNNLVQDAEEKRRQQLENMER